MKKCRGCGVTLQDKNPDEIGYVLNLSQDYCKRCFRLSHYGDVENLRSNYVTNEKIFDIYAKYANALFVVIIDILDIFMIEEDDLMDIFSKYNTLLVVNKTDLMPANVSDEKLQSILTKQLFALNKKYPNIRSAIMTNKHEDKFNAQFYETLESLNARMVVFAGRANAGKSSLINKLIKTNSLTTSMYPGTTLSEVEIDFDKYIFIDTPGLVDVNNYSTYLNVEKYKLSKIDKTIKPQIFQLNDKQSYFYEGLLRVDVLPDDKSSISFFISNNNEIHRTKYENGDDYYEKHYPMFNLKVKPLSKKEYDVNEKQLFVIKGLGLFKVSGKAKVIVYSLADVNVYLSEVNI